MRGDRRRQLLHSGRALLMVLSVAVGCTKTPQEWSELIALDLLSGAAAVSVSSTSPGDSSTGVAVTAQLVVTFNQAMLTNSVTANSTDTTCSGTVQLSTDDFSTCIQMSAAPTASSGDTTFTVGPAANLTASTTYKIRVTTAAQSSAGASLASNFTQLTGFTTSASAAAKRTFITASGSNGGFGSIAAADALCMGDGNYPGSGTYKALLVSGATRRASVTANVGDGQVDWVLAASTAYYRSDGTTLIFTTAANSLFNFAGTLTNSFGTGGPAYWTGLAADWTNGADSCAGWTDGTVGSNGERGAQTATDGTSIANGNLVCSTISRFVCVEQ